MQKFMLFVASCSLVTLLLLYCGSQENNNMYAKDKTKDAEEQIKKLGVKLHTPRPFKASFVRSVRTGNLVYLSGHIPIKPEVGMIKGKVGKDLTTEQGKEAAYWVAIGLLSSLKAEIGNLNKVKQIVKVKGMVNATPSFSEHSLVINGCSDLLISIFGERGKHTRAAVGMVSLPFNVAVEIEMIVEVEE